MVIVISGLSGRFPNSDNVDQFWDNLVSGRDMITDEGRRWPPGIHGLPERSGLLRDIASFDAPFFGVSAKQAHQMDPQLRLLLEVSYEAIIDSGYHPSELEGKNIGVYIGGSSSEAYDAWTTDPDKQSGYGLLGCCRCMLANRVAFTFDFRGPSYTLDTACSSSMFAVDAAFKAIESGECDMALAGGVNLLLKPNTSVDFHRLSMLSQDGKCKVFDEEADGYVRAETVAAVLISRENVARRTYARVLGSKTNTDGFKTDGITYPNHEVQSQLLSDLYKKAGVLPNDVYYLEMHGTGTQAGDTQEMLGVEKFFLSDSPSRERPLYVGSVKSNMGHSEPASGLAALVKVLLAYHYNKIPANINFNTANPKLTPLVDGRVSSVTSGHLELRTGDIIGVNSFGFGGANAHVILQGVAGEESRAVDSEIPMLVPYFTRGHDNTVAALSRIRDEHVTADKLSYLHMIAQEAPTSHVTRGYVVLNGVKRDPVVADNPARKRPIWFIMTGMGAQWNEMGRDMLRYATFRRSIDECCKALSSVPGCTIDLYHLLTSPSANLQTATHAFVSLCAIQIGLVDLLREFGLVPDGLVGHSVGELVCAYADRCLDIKQTILSSYFRGKCISDADLGEGGMAAVGLTWDEATRACPPGVVPACHNSQESVTVSGKKALVDGLVDKLSEDGIFAKGVQSCGVAFHSPDLTPVGPALEQCLKHIIPEPKTRSTRWICTSRKEADWDLASLCDASYMSNNLVSPVLFHDSLSHIPEGALVVEIAACGLLQPILKRALPTCTILPLMKRKDPKCVEYFLNSIGKLWNEGVNPTFGRFYETPTLPLVNLPPMGSMVKWDHSVQYTTPSLEDYSRGSSSTNQVQFSYKVDTLDTTSPYYSMSHHVIDGRNLLPATGYLYFVWKSVATATYTNVDKCHVTFEDVTLHQATILRPDEITEITVVLSPGLQTFEVATGGTLAVSGGYSIEGESGSGVGGETENVEEGSGLMLDTEGIYKELRLRGYEYKELYQGILTANNQGTAGNLTWNGDWTSFLDTMLQVQLIGSQSRALRLPTRIRRLSVNPTLHPPLGTVPFSVNHATNQCVAGGVIIQGLHTTLTQRRSPGRTATLETYMFTPFHQISCDNVTCDSNCGAVREASDLIESEALRTLLDIAQENITGFGSISVLEVGGATEFKRDTEAVLNSNPGRPVCSYTLAVGAEEQKLDNEEIKCIVWDVSQPIPGDTSFNIVVTSWVACGGLLDNVLGCLTPDEGFLVLLSSAEDDLPEIVEKNCVASRRFRNHQLSLIRRREERVSPLRHKFITVHSDEFIWVESVQAAVTDTTVDRIWLLGDNSTGVQGLCNALRHEEGAHKIRSILSPTQLDKYTTTYIVEQDLVNNVYVDGKWGTYRHHEVSALREQRVTLPEQRVTSSRVISAYVDTLTRGDLSSLSWIQSPVSMTTGDIIRCVVSFASLNFRDVMIATGKLPPDALPLEMQGSTDCVLGLEFSGHTESGEEPQRVMGILPAKALATTVTTRPQFTWEVPEEWSLRDAASVPVVYCTAYYSLIVRGRLRSGEKVLIHSGSGGVGQAAIAIALHLNCEVFTTVGSPEKVDFLLTRFSGLSRNHILHSRSTQFEQDILNMTQSRGVHVVLNSLAGDKLQASLRCLARHGRFLEIGKFDMSENSPVGMALFLKNISFHGILLDALFEDGNNDWEDVKLLMEAGIREGVVRPLPTTLFHCNQLEAAFRFMAQGKHIGKVVISTQDEKGHSPETVVPKFSCHGDKCYVVTGGLGGFGLELVQWLAEHGARHIVLTSRSGPRTSYQHRVLHQLGQSGVTVQVVTHDTTTRDGVLQLLTDTSCPVTAIFHLAGILRDGLLENLGITQFEEVFKAKVDTGRHLDAVSRDLCPDLEHFVCFSSVVSGRGNAGQANYAAANSVLERICEGRVRDNLPGLAIQWGAVGDVGMAHEMAGNDANIGGTYPQRIWDCLSTMSKAMTLSTPVLSSIVLADKESSSGKSDKEVDLVVVVSNIMGASDPSKLDHSVSLGDLGLDSLMGVEVKQALDRAEIRLSNKEIRALTLSDISKLQDSPVLNEVNPGTTNTVSCIAELKVVEGTVPLYLVHPITLDIEPLVNIAQHLPCTVHAVQFTSSVPLLSLESVAAHYLSEIRNHAGESCLNFRLGGYSFGAVLAFEMALQMDSVPDYVVLIDGTPNWVTAQIECYKLEVVSKRSGELDRPAEAILGFIRRTFGDEPEGLYEKLTKLSPDLDAQMKVALNILTETWPKLVLADTERKLTYFSKLMVLADQYSPKVNYLGNLHLVKAINSQQGTISEDYDLKSVCRGDILVDTVPGNHESCVSLYHGDIASHIIRRLQQLGS